MLLLVLGSNLLVVFVGWEGVGLASYLLIGFWFEDPEKTAAGVKAFIVNRVGDAGFVVAAFLIYIHAGSFDFQAINAYFSTQAPSPAVTTTIGLLLLLGACGKSAQIPLHVWLPDAMAGPTPVSALIHAATMVTAGVYLLARLNGLYLHAPEAMAVVAWIGAATALLGATMGVTQFNLKKVLAYSTISQIGFMVMACGVGAFSVGLFHLMTHAFFKACLFLGAGAVLHALQGEEDMRNMGALARKLPFTFATFLAGDAGAVRNPAVRRLLLEGRDPLAGLVGAGRLARAVARRPRGLRAHRVLHVPRDLPHVLRHEPCRRNGFGPACTSRRLRWRSSSPCSPSARSSPGSSACPASCASSSASRRRSTTFSRRCSPRRAARASRREHRDRADGDRASRGGRGHLPGVAPLRSRRPRGEARASAGAGRADREPRLLLRRGLRRRVRPLRRLVVRVRAGAGTRDRRGQGLAGAARRRRAPRVAAPSRNCRPATCKPTSSTCSWVSRSRSGGD